MGRVKKENVIIYGIKYRFYPTEEQKAFLNEMFGARRFFWNKILRKYNELYEQNKEIKKYNETAEEKKDLISYNLLCGANPNTKLYGIQSIIEDGKKELDEEGKAKDYAWLKKYHNSIYESIIEDLAKSWDRFYNYIKEKKNGAIDINKVGAPKIKRKDESASIRLRNTNTLVDGKNVINWKKGLIKTPGFNKIGFCKCTLHRRFKGKVKYTTISLDKDGKYYISLTVEESGSFPKVDANVTKKNIKAIDFGVKTHATIANAEDDNEHGEKFNFAPLDKINELYEKIGDLQRKSTNCSVTFSRKNCESFTITVKEMNKRIQENKHAFRGWKKTFSKGYEEYRLKINKICSKIRNINKNYICEFAKKLVTDENTNAVVVETLGLGDMVARDKTKKAEGKRLSKKNKFRKAMARKMHRAIIGKAIEQIEYDCKKEGKYFVKAPRRFASTKICSCCGYKLPSIDLGTRKWVCPNCGAEHDRDINAAKNLAKYGFNQFNGVMEQEKEVVYAESAN